MESITFDKSVKSFILQTFSKTVNGEGLIVESEHTDQLVLSPEGQEIREEEFAGVKKGSEVYIKKDLVSLIKISDTVNNGNELDR